jgi:serine/threonine protein kinase
MLLPSAEPFVLHPATDVDNEVERRVLDAHIRGQYQIVRELGRGGMGVVFLARDLALHRTVAIKVLRHDFVDSDEHRERFRREARFAARLSHPGIVPVYTFGESPELVFIVMQYVRGVSLAERIRTSGRLPAAEAARVLRELAETLAYAHGEGMVHCDLKAENVLIERSSGRVYLTDFGVARLRAASPDDCERLHAFGTPHYMSPEQAVGESDIDGRSDLYSLGVLGYLMLAGELPFQGTSFTSLAAQHVVQTPAPLAARAPTAPEPLVEAVERCLAKERDDRWKSAGELRDALNPSRPWRRWAWNGAARIGPWGWAKVVAALAAAVVLLGR